MTDPKRVDRQFVQGAVAQFERPLIAYAMRMLGDVERARDVVQDTFLKLWQADRETVEDHLAKWLYTVCRNRALDVRRKEQRMTRLEEPQHRAAQSEWSSPDGETTDGMASMVGALPPRQQEAVRLKFQGELSYREIAEVMETTVSNVGVLLHTALKNIRTRMAEPAENGSGTENQLPGAGTEQGAPMTRRSST